MFGFRRWRRRRASLVDSLRSIAEAAQWEAVDLQSRWGPEATPDLLRGRSAELAGSPAGRDQLLGLAIDQLAAAIAAGQTPLRADLSAFLARQEASADQLRAIRARAEALPTPAAETLGPGEGVLAERLWCDPRIPADDETRARMLARSRAAQS